MMNIKNVSVAYILLVLCGIFANGAEFKPDQPNEISFQPIMTKYVRLVIREASSSQPCIDELEVYGPDSNKNLSLQGKPNASSCISGYSSHKTSHLNDGIYGNDNSWIPATLNNEWAQIELSRQTKVSKIVFSRDRTGRYNDRFLISVEVQLSLDGINFTTVARVSTYPVLPEGAVNERDMLDYTFDCEKLMWQKAYGDDPLDRVFGQMEEILKRFTSQGVDVSSEIAEFVKLQQLTKHLEAKGCSEKQKLELFYQARLAKRQLFLRAPELAELRKILTTVRL